MEIPNKKIYYIGHGKIEGPLSIIEISVQRTSPWTIVRNITAISEMNKEYRGKEYDFKTAEQLINTPIWIDGNPTVIVKIENKEVTALLGRYGCYIFDLNRISLKPEENFSLTNEREDGKVPEMKEEPQSDIQRAVAKLDEIFTRCTEKLCDSLKSLNSPQIGMKQSDFGEVEAKSVANYLKNLVDSYRKEIKILNEKAAESVAISNFAARPNKKILVLDSRRDVLKQAFTIGVGTQIDIMRDDDPRIGQKNYDLIVGDLPANKVPDTQKSFDYSVETVQTKLPEVTAEQILEGAVYPNYKIILVASSYRNAKVAFERIERMADDKGISTEVSKGTDRLEMKIGDSKIIATSLTEKVRGYRGNCIVITDKVNQKQLDELILPLLTIKDSNPFFPYVTLLNFKWE